MCGDGGEDQEGFEREGLVVGPCEEEGAFGGVDVLCEEGDERGAGVVAQQVQGGRDDGVFLQSEERVAHGCRVDAEGCGCARWGGWEVGA